MAHAVPAELDLKTLFREASMFDSRGNWDDAGFQVVNRSSGGKIMVARHPSVAGLLFKKYESAVSRDDQFENYRQRIEGSDHLRAFVSKRRLSRVVVPTKWLLDLPRSTFGRDSCILVVEQIDLLDDDQSKAAYHRIDPNVLVELCTVLFHFRGMDSNTKNIPFTSDGRIAFIDTEHWDRGTSKSYLEQVGEYMSSDGRKLARKIFRRLEEDEDTSDDMLDEFEDEEDTSSSS